MANLLQSVIKGSGTRGGQIRLLNGASQADSGWLMAQAADSSRLLLTTSLLSSTAVQDGTGAPMIRLNADGTQQHEYSHAVESSVTTTHRQLVGTTYRHRMVNNTNSRWYQIEQNSAAQFGRFRIHHFDGVANKDILTYDQSSDRTTIRNMSADSFGYLQGYISGFNMSSVGGNTLTVSAGECAAGLGGSTSLNIRRAISPSQVIIDWNTQFNGSNGSGRAGPAIGYVGWVAIWVVLDATGGVHIVLSSAASGAAVESWISSNTSLGSLGTIRLRRVGWIYRRASGDGGFIQMYSEGDRFKPMLYSTEHKVTVLPTDAQSNFVVFAPSFVDAEIHIAENARITGTGSYRMAGIIADSAYIIPQPTFEHRTCLYEQDGGTSSVNNHLDMVLNVRTSAGSFIGQRWSKLLGTFSYPQINYTTISWRDDRGKL